MSDFSSGTIGSPCYKEHLHSVYPFIKESI